MRNSRNITFKDAPVNTVKRYMLNELHKPLRNKILEELPEVTGIDGLVILTVDKVDIHRGIIGNKANNITVDTLRFNNELDLEKFTKFSINKNIRYKMSYYTDINDQSGIWLIVDFDKLG